jgi:hypothetical protein
MLFHFATMSETCPDRYLEGAAIEPLWQRFLRQAAFPSEHVMDSGPQNHLVNQKADRH